MGFLLGGKTQAAAQTVASGVAVQSSVYGAVIPILYGQNRLTGNLIWYGDFQAIAQKSGQAGGGKGGGDSTGSSNYDYKASFAFALCEGPIDTVLNVWASKTETAFGSSNLGLEAGATGQTPWPYLTTKHSGQDLAYRGTAYLTAETFDLGDSAQLPNLSFEAKSAIADAIAGQPDADPAIVISDFLTSAAYGVGFPSSRLGSLTVFSEYCRAAGLVVSPIFNQQTDAASLLNEIVQQCNAEFAWSGSQLTIVPYGDQNLSANGATYTAPAAALYSLTDDDFLETGSGDPVQVSRARPSDRMNAIKLEWLNRNNQYATEIVEAKDQAAIELYGLRAQQSRQAHFFCNPAAATMSATLQLQRQAVRNQYSFTLGWKYALLDPMDIVEITDSSLGLDQQWVRVLSIEEDDNGNLTIIAEEYLGGSGGAPLYGAQTGSPYIANYGLAPGPVNTPIIFEPPPALLAFGQIYNPEVWIGVSGGALWGGCNVWLSADNATYERIGQITSPARMGSLTANFPSGGDPDTVNTLAVDLSESLATLYAGTQDDADSYRTLCFVDGELVSYEQATLTAADAYDLGKHGATPGYLRRGAFGSTIAAHASGAPFLRLDNNVFKFALPASYVGETLYVKFTSFNAFGNAEEDLSAVAAYSYDPTGAGGFVSPPSGCAITTAATLQPDGTVIPSLTVAWTASTDPLFDQYDVEYKKHSDSVWIAQRVGSGTLSLTVSPLVPGVLYDAKVRAVRSAGSGGIALFSTFSVATSVSTVGRTAAPAAATSLTITAGYQNLTLDWTASGDSDVDHYEIWESTDNVLAHASLIGSVSSTHYVRTGLGNAVTRYYWVRAVNTSSIPSATYLGPQASITLLVATADLVGQIVGAQIAANTIAAANLISGNDIVQVVGTISLASSGTSHIAFATDTNEMYRWDGSAWIDAVAAASITGTLTNSQIADLAAAKLTGQITGTQITNGAISTPKLAAGAVTAATIAANTITAAQIAASTITGTQIAGATITGTNIAGTTITAAKIASGTITSGQIQAGGITGTNIAGGTITGTNIAANTIAAGNIISGTISTGQIAANAITTQLINGNAVTVPIFAQAISTFTGIGGYQAVVPAFNVVLGVACEVAVIFGVAQGFSSGARNWDMTLKKNGTAVFTNGGTSLEVAPSAVQMYALPAGLTSFQLDWQGADSTVALGGAWIVVIGCQR